MRPSIATVVSALAWERDLATLARASATVRLVRRCHTVADVERVMDRIDSLVVGAETAWLSVPLLRRWGADVEILGMASAHDQPGRDLLRSGGVAEVFDHTRPSSHVIAAITSSNRLRIPASRAAPVVTVIGPRGSPGRTEVAIALGALAAESHHVLLTELDVAAPGLGVRLGLDPSPGMVAADPATTSLPMHHRSGPLSVAAWPARGGPLSPALMTRVLEMARAEFEFVIVDGGPALPEDLGLGAGRTVLVVQPSPNGLIRAGRMIADWTGHAPLVVANRVPATNVETSLRLVRAATGLEPAAVIPVLEPDVAESGAPATEAVTALRPLATALFGLDHRSAAR